MEPSNQNIEKNVGEKKKIIGSRKFWLTFTGLIVYGVIQSLAIFKGVDTQAFNTGLGIAGILAPSALSYVSEYWNKLKPNGK